MKRIKNYRKSARLTKKHLIFLSVIDIIQGASYLNEVDYFTSRQNGHHINRHKQRLLEENWQTNCFILHSNPNTEHVNMYFGCGSRRSHERQQVANQL